MSGGGDEQDWYDGAFYARVVDPWLEGVRRRICSLVDPAAEVLDVGCGTGRLLAGLSPRCGRVVGVDVSEKMVEYARGRRLGNVTVRHADATDFVPADTFDYAVASLVLHGVPERRRERLLDCMAGLAGALILADYAEGEHSAAYDLRTAIPELMAGLEHFRCYRSFLSHGGTTALLRRHGFSIERQLSEPTGTYRIALATRGGRERA